jgi:DHA1 family tetracycline resistance protein-like MFS transporter
MTSAVHPPPAQRAAVAFVMVTVLLDMLAMSIIIPVLPRLVLQFSAGDTASASGVMGVFGTAWNLMQFAASPVIGALSDRYGRRPVILLSNFGLGLDYVLMALAPGLTLLFVGRLVSGITAASFSTAGAYIADISPPERRAAGFGLLNVAFGIGFVLGPALGGLLGGFDPRLPFWVAAGLSLLNGAYGAVVLPESLPPDRRAAFTWRRANPLASLRLLSRHRQLAGIATVNFLVALAQQSLMAVFVLYSSYRYGWDARDTGLSLAGYGLCSALVGGVLVRPAVTRLGERRVLLLGLLLGAAGFLAFGLAPTSAVVWAGLPVLAMVGFAGPAAQAIMTRLVPASEQGRLQGAGSSVMSLSGLVGPGLFTLAFASAVNAEGAWHVPGAPYLLAAAIMGAATALAFGVTFRRKQGEGAALDPLGP